MDRNQLSTSGTCVLCDRPVATTRASGPSIGFCPSCAGEMGMVPTEDVLTLTSADRDLLPFGFITVDSDGVVEAYNAFEAQLSGLAVARVLGRNFFSEVAPCTAVREFEGRFRRMVADGDPVMERFRYLFRFQDGEELVQITMTYLPDRRKGILIVRAMERA